MKMKRQIVNPKKQNQQNQQVSGEDQKNDNYYFTV